jgi:superoxide dismutase, Cu-Zn family
MKSHWLLTGFLLGWIGCSTQPEELTPTGLEYGGARSPERAIAVVSPTEGHQARGTVIFQREGVCIRIIADFVGLTPGEHGFHIHEFGDCSASDASSAGGHFNPGHEPHGSPFSEIRHVGDLGNVVADAEGRAHFERLDTQIQFEGPASILGRSVVLHDRPDDFQSQPAGNSGARVACGVIRRLAP